MMTKLVCIFSRQILNSIFSLSFLLFISVNLYMVRYFRVKIFCVYIYFCGLGFPTETLVCPQ